MKISQEIKETLDSFPEEDSIFFNNKIININKNNFQTIYQKNDKTLAFIDGGQAEIISAGNFCLSFIRIFAQLLNNNKKIESHKNEFYLFTKAEKIDGNLHYISKIFTENEQLIEETDLIIDSNDATIRNGIERAPISKIANMARRFAELSLAAKISADYIILDGTLKPTFKNEEKYLTKLAENVCALAKTSQLFTTSGNSPAILLNKLGLEGCWSYFLNNKTCFVKLHEKAKHIFRFEGSKEVLPYLIQNSTDPLFLGYPYGLIFTDKLARISNTEKNSLKTKFLLKNKQLLDYLTTTNAHDILDSLS
jgi:hypothetical protein